MKKILIVVLILVLGVTVYQIGDTFALFETVTNNESDVPLANWKIEVNGIDAIKHNTFSLNDIVWNMDSHVLEGKAAPGLEGYFDIIIDPLDTEVSLRYDITFDFDNMNGVDVSGSPYEINGNALIHTGDWTYTGIISLDEIVLGETHAIRVELRWIDYLDDAYEVGSIYGNTLGFDANIKFSQYLGEEIEEYFPPM